MASTFVIADVQLTPYELEPGQTVSGEPVVSDAAIWTAPDGSAVRGIWTCTPGAIRMAESEIFVVVEGRATVAPEGGRPFDIGPGSAVILDRATPVVLEVRETLRKCYHMELVPPADAE
ncbi:cupin domain-containing protein [Streptomyces sp. NPDC051940]|uniref:cupin domain-containing protein n=1 Tax=Streptomyces sp. NPDC051940 TaxID=3155675 RepID=UPI003426D5E9